MQQSHNALISLGGNLGDVTATFQTALAQLDERPGIAMVAVSGLYQTKPIGVAAGAEFSNAAATLRTTLSPEELLRQLHEVEHVSGRERKVHWGPRTLDLDLILYEQAIVESPDLLLPHPAAFYRRFVLDPAVEIAADWRHPTQERSLQELRDRLMQRPLPIAIAPAFLRDAAVQQVVTSQPVIIVEAATAVISFNAHQPARKRSAVADLVHQQMPDGDSRCPGCGVAVNESIAAEFIEQVLNAALDDPVRTSSLG